MNSKQTDTNNKKNLLIVVVFFLAPLFIIGSLLREYNRTISSPIGVDEKEKQFVIEEGLSGYQVIEKLVEENFVRKEHELYLKVYLKINKIPSFQQGTFNISQKLTPKELFETLQNPESQDIWITIPEGLRADEIAKILEQEFSQNTKSVFNKNLFLGLTSNPTYIQSLNFNIPNLTTLEGFLFPDKYMFPPEATEEYVISYLTNNFKLKTGGVYTYEDVIVASMVEREGYTTSDRPLIADVITKRLNEGWLLQIDATLLYYFKDWKHGITLEDKEITHPYNTYKLTGLPPTPICNPGLESIKAAQNPKASPYYYYLHDKTKVAHFSTTYEEHQANISKYLR